MAECVKNEEKVKGVRLTWLNVGIFLTQIIVIVLLYRGINTISAQYQELSDATDQYQTMTQTVWNLENSVEKLSELARQFAATKDETYVQMYFDEYTRFQDQKQTFSKEKQEVRNPMLVIMINDTMAHTSEFLQKNSHAIRLGLESKGDSPEDYPDEFFSYPLSEQEKELSSQEQLERTYQLLFGEEYFSQKEALHMEYVKINEMIGRFIMENEPEKQEMFHVLISRQKKMMAGMLCLMLFTTLLLTLFVVFPLYQLVDALKQEKVLNVMGVYEIRYLASVYNHMCVTHSKSNLELNIQAKYDSLTGILNRGSFDRICEIYKDSLQPLALLLIDVDIFKSINDTYGHEVGDQALKKVAGLLTNFFSKEDYVIRYGGDEFVIIMPQTGPAEKNVIGGKIDVINRLLKNPEEEGFPAYSLSVGIAFSQKGYTEEIFKKADRAVYFTKEHGRCGYTFYQEPMTKIDSF